MGKAWGSFDVVALATSLILTATLPSGCTQSRSSSGSDVKTDLGAEGNARVRDELAAYLAKGEAAHCNDTGTGARILYSGFSVFQTFPYNVSGAINQAMANRDLWPDTVTLEQFDPEGSTSLGSTSKLTVADHGGRASQRQLTIDGHAVTVCFVLLEVVWDQAAGILLEESRRFKPDAIIMTGGGVTTTPMIGQFEGGALNQAYSLNGYSGVDGRGIDENTPVRPAASTDLAPILPPDQVGVLPSIPMLWNPQELANLTRSTVRAVRRNGQRDLFDMVGVAGPRSSNTYLCNNTSYVILHAVRGVRAGLAGGLVDIGRLNGARPHWSDASGLHIDTGDSLDSVILAGFVHIPATGTDAAQTMLGWAKVFARIMVEVAVRR